MPAAAPPSMLDMPGFGPDWIPAFKSSLHVEAIEDDVLLVLSASRRLLLRGRAVVRVAGAIDGRRSAAQLVALLDQSLEPDEVLHVLEQLRSKGHLDAAGAVNSADASAARAWWEVLGAEPDAAAHALAAMAVSVASVGALPAAAVTGMRAALAGAGIAVAGTGAGEATPATLHIVLTDDYLRAELAQAVRQARADGLPVLLVRPVGAVPAIGPLLDGADGACLTCLQFWTRINHPVETMLERRGASCHLPLAFAAPGAQAVYAMAVAALATMAGALARRDTLRHHVLTFDLRSFETRRHAVLKRPQCPGCGDAGMHARRANEPPRLQAVDAAHREYGGYRRCDPADTLARYQHLVSPLTGPVSYLHPMPGRHAGSRKVYVAGYMVTPRAGLGSGGFDRICAGKGQSSAQARASALCEALERYSGVYQGDEACVRAAARDFPAGEAILFNDLQQFSERQFAERERINGATRDRRRQVPELCAPDSVIDWTPAWSLVSGRRHYVPLTYCYAEAPPESGSRFGIHNPNGAAAGNCLEEAVLQGLLELVERDACAIWWYNRIAAPPVALDAGDEAGAAYMAQLRHEYAALGWQLWALDLTHDLGIPVRAALARHPGQDRFAVGFGCHLDPHLALQRALTELNQLFDPGHAGAALAPWDAALLGDPGWLLPAGRAQRQGPAPPSAQGSDLKAAIDQCVQLLARQGMDTLVVDKTRPDIGLHVAQVIVPGLRHFWPRFGPGRLYSVPPALGWRGHALAEAELNPAPLFL
jgi:oxazoline/thiazoline synthase